MPPERAMTAETAVIIANAVSHAYGSRAPGRLIRLVRTQRAILASSLRVPARKPAAAPRRGPVLTITPATSPAMKGPACGRPAPRMRLMRDPTPMANRKSAVLSWEVLEFLARESIGL